MTGWLSGGPIEGFTHGWARIPFTRGDRGHYWRATPPGVVRHYSNCGLAVELRPGVTPLGVGTGPLCRHCMKKSPAPTAAEKRTFFEDGTVRAGALPQPEPRR